MSRVHCREALQRISEHQAGAGTMTARDYRATIARLQRGARGHRRAQPANPAVLRSMGVDMPDIGDD